MQKKKYDYTNKSKLRQLSFIIILSILTAYLPIQLTVTDSDILKTGGINESAFVKLMESEIISAPVYGIQDNIDENGFMKLSSIYSIDGSTDYGYSSLTPVQKTCYMQKMDAAFNLFLKNDYKNKDYTSKGDYVVAFSVDCTDTGLTLNDLLKVYFAYRHDNPQYYWLSTSYSYSTGKSVIVTVCMDMMYASASVRKQCDAVIAKATKEYLAEVNKYNDIYDIVLAVHDKIITDIDYAYDKYGNPSDEIWAHNIMGVFEKRGAVCEGYAKAFQYILNIIGIETIYVTGDADGGGHAWNLVKIDGEYYCVDITWDDFNDKYNGINYVYFCMPASKFALTHTAYHWSANVKEGKWLYKLPTASNSYEKTYYITHNSYAANLTKDTVNSFINDARNAESGSYVHILSDSNSKNLIMSALKIGSYEFRNYGYLFVIGNNIGNNKNTAQNSDTTNHFFLDQAFEIPVKKSEAVIWAGSGERAASSGKTNSLQAISAGSYKDTRQMVLYTDVIASNIITTKENKTTRRAGKVIVGITLSNKKPVLRSNKIIDTEAAKIAKASIKDGKITVRAQKEAGTVYLWVYDIGDAKVISYVPITVKEAS